MPDAPHVVEPLRSQARALAPGLTVLAVMVLWIVHDGGYDADTWYWGALVVLATLVAVLVSGAGRVGLSRSSLVALILLGAYVAWSYLSITWAESPGDALQGSNRALLYLLVFALMLVLPWRTTGALLMLTLFSVVVGVVALVLLFRLAAGDHVSGLLIGGRLAAPTGYFNSTAALFTMGALVATTVAARRELPGPVRGFLVASACAELQLAVSVQSRGWLFTLPVVLIVAAAVSADRLRAAAAGGVVVLATLVPLHRLLEIYSAGGTAQLEAAAARAAREGLLVCCGAFFLATLLAWFDAWRRLPAISRRAHRMIGTVAVLVCVFGAGAGALVATHGHPFRFVSRQWYGFSHVQKSSSGSHFGDVGSGRYDFWRVSLDALAAHPVGGLGQDNFADYYITRRRTSEEPAWTHSLEMRLLAHTGLVGFALFVGFLIAAVMAALKVRRGGGLSAAVAGCALLPLSVWLIHGSVDWFWEMPALSGPALGFLAMAAAIERPARVTRASLPQRQALRRATLAGGAVAAICATVVLGLPYLSVREVSRANDIAGTDPATALHELTVASDLNPLSATPGSDGGAIALRAGRIGAAARLFRQSLDREPEDWFSWLGAGLAASAQGRTAVATRDFRVARSIDDQQPAISAALDRAGTSHPLTPAEAFQMLVVIS